MSEQDYIEDLKSSVTGGFGDRLKTVRQEKNLSIADISSQLRLDEGMIRALEEYDYAALPEPMFVCGYIRNYAKLLDIQPEPLIEYYKNDVAGNLIPKLDVKNESRHVRSYSLGKLLPLVFLLLFIAIIFVSWQWWQSHSSDFEGSSISRWLDFNKKATDREAGAGYDEGYDQDDPNQLQLPDYPEEPFMEEPLLPEPVSEKPVSDEPVSEKPGSSQINENSFSKPVALNTPSVQAPLIPSTEMQ